MIYQEDPDNYYISRKMHNNLIKIFKFYSGQHNNEKRSKSTFDEQREIANSWIVGDYLKFCKDFNIPIKKEDQIEVFRKKKLRAGAKHVDFELFQEILREIFFVKETEELITIKKREVKILTESNLTWSMEKKQDALKEIEKLLEGKRDKNKDHIYLFMAHEYINTADAKEWMKKIKSVQIPFQYGKVDKGVKINEHSFEPYDPSKVRYVPSPRTGLKVVESYDDKIEEYFKKKHDT